MSRIAILAAAVLMSIGSAACEGDSEGEIEVRRSGLGGFAGGAPLANTVSSAIRGYTGLTAAGGSMTTVPTHAAVYRAPGSGNQPVYRRATTSGTIVLGPAQNLGGNVLSGSAPWGYMRSDNVDVVLYIDINRHVHQIRYSGSTVIDDLDFCVPPISAPVAFGAQMNGPVPDVIGYVRSGNRSAVIYRSLSSAVIEILYVPGLPVPWQVYNLSSRSGAQFGVGKGSPFPYVRSDGYNTIVYTATDGHIHELATFGTPASSTGTWTDYDLSAYVGTFTPATTDPWGFQRSDGCNSVVYVAEDGSMHELAFCGGVGWTHGILPAVLPKGGLYHRPSGYVRGDGLNTVVYVSSDEEVHELALFGSGWSDGSLPLTGVTEKRQVFGHRPLGYRGSILFWGMRDGFTHAYELGLPDNTSWFAREF